MDVRYQARDQRPHSEPDDVNKISEFNSMLNQRFARLSSVAHLELIRERRVEESSFPPPSEVLLFGDKISVLQ